MGSNVGLEPHLYETVQWESPKFEIIDNHPNLCYIGSRFSALNPPNTVYKQGGAYEEEPHFSRICHCDRRAFAY